MPVVTTNRPGDRYETAPAPETNGSSPAPRMIADAAPLGLAAFALTTFVLSFYNAGILNAGGTPGDVYNALRHCGASDGGRGQPAPISRTGRRPRYETN